MTGSTFPARALVRGEADDGAEDDGEAEIPGYLGSRLGLKKKKKRLQKSSLKHKRNYSL